MDKIFYMLLVVCSLTAQEKPQDSEFQFALKKQRTPKIQTITITGYTGPGTNIQIPQRIQNIPVTALSHFAFKGLTGVIIPEGITAIGTGAFANNHLTSVIIPDSVVSLGAMAFEGNQLQQVRLSKNLTVLGQLVFASNSLTSIDLPEGLREIQDGAFEENPLIRITIGAQVEVAPTAFGEGFYECYLSQGKKAGTYGYRQEKWERR